jgi:hypothetical protein
MMSRTVIPIDISSDSGTVFVADTAANTTDGNYFINSGNEILFVENAGETSVTVTIDYVADRYGRDGTKTVSVAAGVTKMIGPFAKELYNQPGERVHVNVSAACDLCVISK